jgi:glycosyltransferase involved in cell wall biosynthesis
VPKVSVIVPCFNQGQFVEEAVDSVLSQTYLDFEIIIVNDGSTDKQTAKVLEKYNNPKIRVIHTDNQGLGAARNNGIREARGVYILPLDADDRICPTYMEKAIRVLDENENVGIVYCEAMFFGEKTGTWELPEYQFSRLLLEDNMIFCSAFFRKSDWVRTSGYNSNMVYGWEDHDFWLSLIELGRDVHRIQEVLFYYRKQSGSMVDSMRREQYVYSSSRMFKNHRDLYSDNIHLVFEHILQLRDEAERLYREKLALQNELERMRRELQSHSDWLLFVIARKTYNFLSRYPQLERCLGNFAHSGRRLFRRIRESRS